MKMGDILTAMQEIVNSPDCRDGWDTDCAFIKFTKDCAVGDNVAGETLHFTASGLSATPEGKLKVFFTLKALEDLTIQEKLAFLVEQKGGLDAVMKAFGKEVESGGV